MLVLTRKAGEQIVVPACEVTITVLEIRGNKISLGISAPAQIAVHRGEIWMRICRAVDAVAPDSMSWPFTGGHGRDELASQQ